MQNNISLMVMLTSLTLLFCSSCSSEEPVVEEEESGKLTLESYTWAQAHEAGFYPIIALDDEAIYEPILNEKIVEVDLRATAQVSIELLSSGSMMDISSTSHNRAKKVPSSRLVSKPDREAGTGHFWAFRPHSATIDNVEIAMQEPTRLVVKKTGSAIDEVQTVWFGRYIGVSGPNPGPQPVNFVIYQSEAGMQKARNEIIPAIEAE